MTVTRVAQYDTLREGDIFWSDFHLVYLILQEIAEDEWTVQEVNDFRSGSFTVRPCCLFDADEEVECYRQFGHD